MQSIITLAGTQSSLHIRPFVAWSGQQVSAPWSRYAAWRARRASLRALRALDDRMLEDIGLTRGDLDEAVRNLRQRAA